MGIHPNTVRLYEEIGFIPKPLRKANGYRIFTPLHLQHIKVVRLALQIEVLQGGLRKQIIKVIKVAATKDYQKAIALTKAYIRNVEKEMERAREAIGITEALFQKTRSKTGASPVLLKRSEVSEQLGITMDTLRNWEMNGLIHIKRKKNGYRMYDEEDIVHLKIIRTLRCSNYSLSAILRMMNTLRNDKIIDVEAALNTPTEEEDIISVCDRLLVSLQAAKENANQMLVILKELNNNNPPF